MEFAAKWRERSPLIRRLALWQESLWYPIVYALLCTVAALNNKYVYLPILGVLTVFIVFSALFVQDKKVFLVPMFMVFCSLGSDNAEFLKDGQRTNVFGVFDTDALICICLIGVIMVSALLVRFFKDGSLLEAFRQKGAFLKGLLAMSVALVLGGTLSEKWTPFEPLLGLFLAFGFIFIYCLVFSLLKESKDVTSYACFCMVCTAAMITLQVLFTVLRLHAAGNLIHYYETLPPRLRRENIQLAWGYATNIAGVTILGIPAALYLARNKRLPALYCALAVLFWCTALVLGTRSAFLAGAVILVFCILLGCLKGKNAKSIRLFAAALLVLGVVAVWYLDRTVFSLHELLDKVLNFLRLDNLDELDRFDLWLNGWNDFVDCPIFGVGYTDGGVDVKTETSHVFADMYHNIIFEFLGAMGAVGALSFLWHVKDLAVCLFRRFSINKFLLMLLPFTVLVTSLADNFFFYINFQIFYCTFLVLAEREQRYDPASIAAL